MFSRLFSFSGARCPGKQNLQLRKGGSGGASGVAVEGQRGSRGGRPPEAAGRGRASTGIGSGRRLESGRWPGRGLRGCGSARGAGQSLGARVLPGGVLSLLKIRVLPGSGRRPSAGAASAAAPFWEGDGVSRAGHLVSRETRGKPHTGPQFFHLWNGDHSFVQAILRASVMPGTVPGVRHNYTVFAVEFTA